MNDRDLCECGMCCECTRCPGCHVCRATEREPQMTDRDLIAEGREKLAASVAGIDGSNSQLIMWARNNLLALLDGLEAVERERDEAHMELSDLRIETETNYVAIAARQQRDRDRVAQALKLIDLHAGYALAGKVRATLEGHDE